jgi:NADPH-dependent ferric siderophore reductase
MAHHHTGRQNKDSVEDSRKTLDHDDHMQGMERLEMEVLAVERPFASVVRVTGAIRPENPLAWAPPNQAVRIAVETPEGQRPVMRVYTIRHFDPQRSQVQIDFVHHEDDSPAMRWLAAAGPGTRVGMIGPRQHFVPQPVAGKRAAIFTDETGIPAVHAILSAWPAGMCADLWVETWDRAAFDELPRPEGVEFQLLLRRPEQPAGTTGQLLAAARALKDAPSRVVWAAGERVEMRDLRNHFAGAGVPREQMQVLGYWKQGLSSSDLDRVRLAEYEALLARGKTIGDLEDMDLPV